VTNEIRLVQFFELEDADGKKYRFQNYFVGDDKSNVPGLTGEYEFAPFQVQGSVSSLNGDNSQIQVLFPAIDYAIRLVEKASGNRRSRLTLTTRTVTAAGAISDSGPQEIYIGLGASFSEDTIELRFNTAADSVASNFPARRLGEDNVGFLPLDSALSLR